MLDMYDVNDAVIAAAAADDDDDDINTVCKPFTSPLPPSFQPQNIHPPPPQIPNTPPAAVPPTYAD